MSEIKTKEEAARRLDALEKKEARARRAAERALRNGGQDWADRENGALRTAAECRTEADGIRAIWGTLPEGK